MHPRGYLTLRLYLARARTNIGESSFGCLAKAVVTNRTTHALRLLRRQFEGHCLAIGN